MNKGFTLIEMLVTLVILSILASVALPHAKGMIIHSKEIELRQALREVREAIDSFHDDWKAGYFSFDSKAASQNGYPVSLEVLVEGVDVITVSDGLAQRKRYLRTIPRDPFFVRDGAKDTLEPSWRLLGYSQSPGTEQWNGVDVYDLRSRSEQVGKDGRRYDQW